MRTIEKPANKKPDAVQQASSYSNPFQLLEDKEPIGNPFQMLAGKEMLTPGFNPLQLISATRFPDSGAVVQLLVKDGLEKGESVYDAAGKEYLVIKQNENLSYQVRPPAASEEDAITLEKTALFPENPGTMVADSDKGSGGGGGRSRSRKKSRSRSRSRSSSRRSSRKKSRSRSRDRKKKKSKSRSRSRSSKRSRKKSRSRSRSESRGRSKDKKKSNKKKHKDKHKHKKKKKRGGSRKSRSRSPVPANDTASVKKSGEDKRKAVAPVPLATASGGGGGGGGHAAPRPVPAKRRPIGPGGPPARSDREMARTARYITPTMNAGQIQPVIDLLRQGGIALTKGPHQPGAWHFTVGNIHFYFTQGSDPWQITSYSIEKQVGQRPPRSMGGGSFH